MPRFKAKLRVRLKEIRVKLTRCEKRSGGPCRRPRPIQTCTSRTPRAAVLLEQENGRGISDTIISLRRPSKRIPGTRSLTVGLADSWVPRAWYGYLPPKEAFPHAKEAVAWALELDPGLAEAHMDSRRSSICTTILGLDSRGPRVSRCAIQLNTNYANAYHWYGEYLSLIGQHDNAIQPNGRGNWIHLSIINTWVGSRYLFAPVRPCNHAVPEC